MRVCVTFEAVFKFEMGLSLMTLCALRYLAMDRVAGGTVKRAMSALIVPEFSILLRMTGKTNAFVR